MVKKFGRIKFDSIARFYPVPVNLVLPYGYNNITFDFAAIEPARPGLVHYQYMMEGYEKDWNPVSSNTNAAYGNLREGSYTFKLKAQSPDGVWSKPLTYTFKVLPPWYRTLWAYILYMLIFITVLWNLISWRVRTLKKEKSLLEQKITLRTRELRDEKEKVETTLSELKATQSQLVETEKIASLNKVEQAMLNERLRISRELHDDIGSTLSGIILYSHMAENQVDEEHLDEAENSLNIIQQSANDMVSRLNDLVWAVNPLHSSVNDLVQKLQEYAIEMATIKDIKVRVGVPESLANIVLPVESLHNIYLFCKESINNAVKYSKATLLELSVRNFDGIIEFKIMDNGEGFDMATAKKGNGLINMQKRAEDAGAILSVNTAPGQGTVITLRRKIT
jgi:signal transduction histidine kinase